MYARIRHQINQMISQWPRHFPIEPYARTDIRCGLADQFVDGAEWWVLDAQVRVADLVHALVCYWDHHVGVF